MSGCFHSQLTVFGAHGQIGQTVVWYVTVELDPDFFFLDLVNVVVVLAICSVTSGAASSRTQVNISKRVVLGFIKDILNSVQV